MGDAHMEQPYVIFSDLDGTLLDFDTYSWKEAEDALRIVQVLRVPLVFCSSKTRLEQEVYQRELGVRAPFIVENGSAVFIPKGYFRNGDPGRPRVGDYNVVELGIPFDDVRRRLERIRVETGLAFKGYADMSLEEVCVLTGLSEEAARRAVQREYSETIQVGFPAEDWGRFRAALAKHGLSCFAGGRFCTVVSSRSDKGRAVRIVSELFRKEWGEVVTIGLGDSPNDEPMLRAVDRPFLVQKPEGTWQDLRVEGLERVPHPGPAGWRTVICDLLEGDQH